MCNRAKDFFGRQYICDVARVHLVNYREHLEGFLRGKNPRFHLENFRAFPRGVKNELGLIDSMADLPEVECEESGTMLKYTPRFPIMPSRSSAFFSSTDAGRGRPGR